MGRQVSKSGVLVFAVTLFETLFETEISDFGLEWETSRCSESGVFGL